ncbi:MAG: hypothetical protein HQL54_06275 [Magnetococcales bacterium]|nr:hypothetical protein [Magnetococcales bacterium]
MSHSPYLSSVEKFQEIKPKLIEELTQAFLETAKVFGEDMKGVEWFGGRPELYWKNQTKGNKAA